MHGAMHKRQHSEFNSLCYGEPVQFAERRRHVSMVPMVYIIVEFLSYVNLHFHFALMQKFKFWHQLEDNSIRKKFGPSVQRSFQLVGQGALQGARPTVHTETAVFPEPIMLLEQMLALQMRNRYGNLLSYYHYSEISIHFYVMSVNVSKRKLFEPFRQCKS